MKFNSFSLKLKILCIVFVSCIVCSIVFVTSSIYFGKQQLIEGIISKSLTIHSRLDAATEYVALQEGLVPAIEKIKKKYTTDSELTKEDKLFILKQVPIFAAMKIADKNADKEHYEFRVFSDEPRRKENLATPFEKNIFDKFLANKSLDHFVVNDGVHVTVYRPIYLEKEKGCLNCHGDPKNSPWGNGKDIIGHQMENWADGKLHGVFAIKTNIEVIAVDQNVKGNMIKSILIGTVPILGALLFAFFLIKNPINLLNRAVDEVNNASNVLRITATQISTNSDSLSQSSIQQTSALQQTASSLEEIKSMVAKTSDNAIETSSFSGQSIKVASRGEGVVNEMISAMEKINQSNKTILDEVNKGNKNLNDVSNLIREIENKTKIINDIVFQTKLLSFNASVEAARAGENGKGFSVVAEEIGNLATLSGTAAKEITQILTDSVSKVDHIVKVTEANVSGLVTSGNENVEYGVKVAQSCGEVLKEIVTNVESSAQMAQEISSASLEQSQGITEISAAINELDAAVHLNTNTSSEVAQAANDLMKQAENLNSLILELNLTVKGS